MNSKSKRYFLILFIIFNMIFSINIIRAQDVVWARDDNQWTSPSFVPSRNTRIEWIAYPLGNEPSFSILVFIDGEGVAEERSGVQGLGYLDNYDGRWIHLDILAVGIRIWEVRLFALTTQPGAMSVATTPPVTTGITTTLPTSTPPITSPITVTVADVTITQVVTVREEIPVTTTIPLTTYTQTVAVYTELPKGTNLVTFTFTFITIGALITLVIILVIVLTKYSMVYVVRRVDFEKTRSGPDDSSVAKSEDHE